MYTRCNCIWNTELKGRASTDPTCILHGEGIPAVVNHPAPDEHLPDGAVRWNTYPFVGVKGGEITVGAECEYVYTISRSEARETAAHLLAAIERVGNA